MSATDEPEIAPKKVLAMMLTSDSPPRTKPTSTPAKATSRRAMPPSAMMAPASTKKGMASSENLFTPEPSWIITASSGNSIQSAPIMAASPSAKATGMPIIISTKKLPSSTKASMGCSPQLLSPKRTSSRCACGPASMRSTTKMPVSSAPSGMAR